MGENDHHVYHDFLICSFLMIVGWTLYMFIIHLHFFSWKLPDHFLFWTVHFRFTKNQKNANQNSEIFVSNEVKMTKIQACLQRLII